MFPISAPLEKGSLKKEAVINIFISDCLKPDFLEESEKSVNTNVAAQNAKFT